MILSCLVTVPPPLNLNINSSVAAIPLQYTHRAVHLPTIYSIQTLNLIIPRSLVLLCYIERGTGSTKVSHCTTIHHVIGVFHRSLQSDQQTTNSTLIKLRLMLKVA